MATTAIPRRSSGSVCPRIGGSFDWQLEFAAPVIADLPATAVEAAPKGQLGLGANYYAANNNSGTDASVFLKQAFLRIKGLGGVAGQSIKIGRMEFSDGGEVTPADPDLAAIKRDRINQRLIGPFGFSDAGRSFDGGQYTVANAKTNVTVFASRPTQGVFQVDGWGELNINVFYGALTREFGNSRVAGEFRVFGVGYQDYRNGVAKIDNRAAAMRIADTGHINIGTYGGDYLEVANTPAGRVDVLFWGVLQNGSWGTLAQRSGAFAAEAGWQPGGLALLRPWIRGGYDYRFRRQGSERLDAWNVRRTAVHTAHVPARTPFFNQMNNEDAFAELTLRPARRLSIRSDVHALKVASTADLWYSGGGAFQPATFGFSGRAIGGNSDLATLYDVSGDLALNPHASVGLYYGYAMGGAIPQAIYASSDALHFAYAELLLRF